MKNNAIYRGLATAGLSFFLLLAGCKKNNGSQLSAQEEELVAIDAMETETESQTAFSDVTDNVLGVNNELGLGGIGIFGRTTPTARAEKVDSLPSCVQITITPLQPSSFPKTVVMDFGTGCASHGHLRSGKIKTVYTGRLTEPGKSATTTFENFKIDSVAIEGVHKLSNTTIPGSNQRQFTITITEGKIKGRNGVYVAYNSTQVQTQIEGNGTLLPGDDIFRITGNSKGTTVRANKPYSWNTEITDPLIKNFTCRWLSKGIRKTVRDGLTANSQWVSFLNFGNGTCDNSATLTINGNVRQITLR